MMFAYLSAMGISLIRTPHIFSQFATTGVLDCLEGNMVQWDVWKCATIPHGAVSVTWTGMIEMQ